MVGVSSNKSNGVESYDGISPFGNAFTYWSYICNLQALLSTNQGLKYWNSY